jgi:sporulation protein YlmC with PRC-barrel domain
MKASILFATVAIACGPMVSGQTWAQGAPQTVALAKVDVMKLAAGYRASKVIGSDIYNDAGDSIGKVDDLLVSVDGKTPYAVLSIGGFLGLGTHLVALPYDSLKFGNDKITLPGGTKDGLRMLPEFHYASK